VLVEWPRLRVPPAAGPVLERLQEDGHQVVLAHPERYQGVDEDLRMPGEWRDRGAFLQANYGSLVGRYGEAPRRRVLTLLERGWVDLFSTDFHGRPHLSIYLTRVREVLEALGGGEQFFLLATVNPARILQGEPPIPVPPLTLKRSLWDKLRKALQDATRW
jgi:protein-tyrosine phosphatase